MLQKNCLIPEKYGTMKSKILICLLLLSINIASLNAYNVEEYTQITLIQRGSLGKMTCTYMNSTSKLYNGKFTWTYHGHPHVQHVHFNAEDGSMYIEEAKIEDNGRYDCWESGNDNMGREVSRQNYHKLIVFQMPNVVLTVKDLFFVAQCVKRLDDITAVRYQAMLCSNFKGDTCQFEVLQKCVHSNANDPSDEITFTVNIRPLDYIPPPCDADCIRLDLALHLDNMKRKLAKEWKELFEHDQKLKKWYHHVPSMQTQSVTDVCPAGFLPYGDAVCTPCEPGYFWSTNKCHACLPHTYQDEGGAIDKCKPCPIGTMTRSLGASNVDKCKTHSRSVTKIKETAEKSRKVLSIFVIGVMVMFVLFFGLLTIVFIVVCIKKRKVAEHESKIDFQNRLKDADLFEELLKSERRRSQDHDLNKQSIQSILSKRSSNAKDYSAHKQPSVNRQSSSGIAGHSHASLRQPSITRQLSDGMPILEENESECDCPACLDESAMRNNL